MKCNPYFADLLRRTSYTFAVKTGVGAKIRCQKGNRVLETDMIKVMIDSIQIFIKLSFLYHLQTTKV